MSTRLEIRTLGGLRILHSEKPITGRSAAMLVYLARTGRTCAREVLAAFFWPDSPQALSTLRTALSDLRRMAGSYVITDDPVFMNPASDYWVDADEFEARLLNLSDLTTEQIEEALALYRGDFLEGVYVKSQEFDDWARAERDRLQLLAMQALDTLIIHYQNQGQYTRAMDAATRLLQIDTLREETHRQLMLLLVQSGQRTRALEQYETCRHILAEELGVAPSPQTVTLYERIRSGELVKALDTDRVDAALQVSSSPATPRSRYDLPVQLTSFIGRQDDIDTILAQLASPECRLLTLVGPGGIGKTRLSIEVAERLRTRFVDGVFFVELAPRGSFEDQLGFAVQHVVTMLREGTSPRQCFEWVAAHGPEPTASAFRELLHDLDQGTSIFEALDTLERRVQSADFKRVIVELQEHVRAGGHLAERLNGASDLWRAESGDQPWFDWEDYPETLLVTAIAEAVGFEFRQGEESKRQQLLNYLREQHILLLLDNFEHLLAGALVIGEMLTAAPGVQVLVTSREPLKLAGEWRYVVGGMHVPESTCAEFDQYDGVQLFAARARQVRPDFALDQHCEAVIRLCQLVGAMPLGIELAAAWVDVLSPDEIAEEITRDLDVLQTGTQDVPERHRSIKTVLNHTWIRLSEAERRVFMTLSVFQGGFTREAATQAAGASLPMLASLSDKSLVRLGADSRYTMHELLRQYAEGHLIARDRIDEARVAHSRYYLDLMANLEHDVKGRRQVAALDQIEADLENVRSAWQGAARHADYAGIGRALESMYLFFDMRNRYQEGEALLRFAVDHLQTPADPDHQFQVSRIQTRRAFFIMHGHLGYPEDVRELFERGLALARERQDHYEMGWCLSAIGVMMFFSESDSDRETENTLQEGLAHFIEANDRYQIADTMSGLGQFQCVTGKIPAGIQNLEEAYRLAREIGNLNIMIYALIHRGYYAAQAELAESNFREAIAIARQIGSRRAIAFVQYHLAFLSFFAGGFDEARRIIVEVLAGAEIHEYPSTRARLLSILSLLASVAGEDNERGGQFARESYKLLVQSDSMKRCNSQCRLSFAIAALSSGDYPAAREELALAFMDNSPPMWWVVMGVCLRAILLAHAGDMKRAVALLALVFSLGDHLTGWMKQWNLLAQLKTTLEHELGTEAYRTAWEHGRTLDLDTVLEDMLTVNWTG